MIQQTLSCSGHHHRTSDEEPDNELTDNYESTGQIMKCSIFWDTMPCGPLKVN